MMDQMISTFIDNEMDLDEKITFVQTVKEDNSFLDKTLEFLWQEKLLRSEAVSRVPVLEMRPSIGWKRFIRSFFKPSGLIASGFAGAIVLLLFVVLQPPPGPLTNRFVIYRPDVSHVEIAGTFTDWQRIPMRKIGTSGYWEVCLELTEGEHRFTYILEGQHPFADPTIPARESDDFGSENSVLYVEQKA